MPRINKTKYAILGLLHAMPMSGYDIKKISDDSIGYFWQENYGHIYPVLRNLEQEGLVVSKKEESQGNPPRIVYTITEKGGNDFDAWLAKSPEPEKYRIELLLKVFFGSYAGKKKTIQHLRYIMEKQVEMLEQYKTVYDHLTGIPHNKKELPYWLFTLSYGQKYSAMQIEWCRECIAELEK